MKLDMEFFSSVKHWESGVNNNYTSYKYYCELKISLKKTICFNYTLYEQI